MNTTPSNHHANQDRTLGVLLASLMTSYPDEECIASIGTVLKDENLDSQCRTGDLDTWKLAREALLQALATQANIDALRSEYIDVFERGRSANPLYETEYGRARALVKGNELADIAGFYRAFGLDPDGEDTKREMLDHVAVELEFYAFLMMKQAKLSELRNDEGVEVAWEARKSFLRDHLGRFVGAIAERPGVAGHPYYSRVFNWCRDLINEECADLGAEPTPAGWVSSARSNANEDEELSCGGSCGAAPGEKASRTP